MIEGLSGSSDDYKEAINCLRQRYDRPRLIHQAHVRAILDAPPLKDGNGKELRRLHDTVAQHLRALRAMDYEPSGAFITSAIELKFDETTMFEWQRHTHTSIEVPHFADLLEFLNMRAQATESLKNSRPNPRHISSFISSVNDTCPACKAPAHSLYTCSKFKSLPYDQMSSIVKSHNLCLNCLKPGHRSKQCNSTQRCRRCQKPHHTLLHLEVKTDNPPPHPKQKDNPPPENVKTVSIVAQTGLKSTRMLLMTCRVQVITPQGMITHARALLDCASSSSFISEHLVQHLCLPRSKRTAQISGIAGMSSPSTTQSVVHFEISLAWSTDAVFEVEAMILPKVTCDLPINPVQMDQAWHHLSRLRLADPDFGVPGKIDILLGIDVFTSVLCQGWRSGPIGSPSAFETSLGWVIAGPIDPSNTVPAFNVVAYHSTVLSTDELLQRFWETEQSNCEQQPLSPEEKTVLDHFHHQHQRDSSGRFIVPLPKKPNAKPLGESQSSAVRRFMSLERSLRAKGQFQQFTNVIEEYFDLNHAEPVPAKDLEIPREHCFYLAVHVVAKESSTTTKIRAVFDASAKSTSGVSLNDQLLIGPTVHSSLFDVLLRFHTHRIALATDVSKMYRAILLDPSDRDLHRFVWRKDPHEPIRDYRMTRLTFGVSSSSFVANMCIKKNAIDLSQKYPTAAKVVHTSFYVDDGLTGADSVEEAIELQRQLQELFQCGGFLLRKWKCSDTQVLNHLPAHLLDSLDSQSIPGSEGFAKTLGLEWNLRLDCFRIAPSDFTLTSVITKRTLVSNIAKVYDILGWFAPVIIQLKILLQRVWETQIGWDDIVPKEIGDSWERWKRELPLLADVHVRRCYFPSDAHIISTQLHCFSDASEVAYSGVIYLRMTDTTGKVHVSLVMSKTKVAPIKRITLPRLELSGAYLLSKLLHHVQGCGVIV